MIDYLKKYSLPFGLKQSVKKSLSRGQSSSYADAKSVLLFFTSEGNQKIALITSLKNKFEKEGKKVKCFYLLVNDEDKPDVGLDDGMVRLTSEDFAFFGKVEKSAVTALLNEEFDFMIHADLERNIYTDIIMSKARAKCRVGIYSEKAKDQYDMMIAIPEGKKINFLLDQICHYIKRL